MTETFVRTVVTGLWLSWLLVWLVTAQNVKRTRWRESAASQLLHRVPLFIAALLLWTQRDLPSFLTGRFLPPSLTVEIAGIAAIVAGLAFAVSARLYLGTNWSAAVTLKEDHSLVQSGPYKYVRHPIYAGILLAFCGTAVVIGQWRGVLAVGLALLAFAYKSRVEESRMRETFPDYDQYSRNTASLIPFIY